MGRYWVVATLLSGLSVYCLALPAFDNFKDDRYIAAARAAFAAGYEDPELSQRMKAAPKAEYAEPVIILMEALRLRELQAAGTTAAPPSATLLEQTAAKIPPGVMDQGTMYRSPAAFRAAPTNSVPEGSARADFEPLFNEDTAAAPAPVALPSTAGQQLASSTTAAAAAKPTLYLDETPEVKAARESFERAYAAALAQARSPPTTAAPLAALAVPSPATRLAGPAVGAARLPLAAGNLLYLG